MPVNLQQLPAKHTQDFKSFEVVACAVMLSISFRLWVGKINKVVCLNVCQNSADIRKGLFKQ